MLIKYIDLRRGNYCKTYLRIQKYVVIDKRIKKILNRLRNLLRVSQKWINIADKRIIEKKLEGRYYL
ncbi:MAG: hypothetical protein A3D13_09015 [Planctomycetes bacterium RIFCSPHIGHO2_02_FULL_40_12]|nr:MAG: hypothetical protein A3D13_09015 [Planctomycetes bacterium RIFCSPHIGHO2_02_FULL_40_12]OHC03947.1 MAG: hypothetical protein A3H23_00845 [Planctomycetes bacterium RIFCSPLOWO2_12_FULL_40_19]